MPVQPAAAGTNRTQGTAAPPTRETRAGTPRRPRPDDHQIAALRGILAEVHRPAPGCALTLLYTGDRRTEASWLCAFARAAGTRVQFASRDGRPTAARASERAALEAAALAAAAAGTAVIVVADRTLNLPVDVLVLPGVPGMNALDLWEPRARIALRAWRFLDALEPHVMLRSGQAGLLAASIGRARLGDPFGCVDADATTVSGIFVADRAIDVNRAVSWDARLSGRPVTLSLHDGRVTSVSCRDPALQLFLTRAVRVHRTDKADTLRFGLRRFAGGTGAVAGPAHRCRENTATLCLGVDPADRHSPASADLRIELSAAVTFSGDGTVVDATAPADPADTPAGSDSGLRGARP